MDAIERRQMINKYRRETMSIQAGIRRQVSFANSALENGRSIKSFTTKIDKEKALLKESEDLLAYHEKELENLLSKRNSRQNRRKKGMNHV